MTPQELKSSILQLAIQGKLVKQRPEEGTGEELYQQIQAEKKRLIQEGKIKKEKPLPEIAEDEVPFEIPESWKWVQIRDIAIKITDGTHHSPANYEQGKYRYVTAKNIKNQGVTLTNITYVSEDVHNEIFARCNPEHGDVLLIKDGATTGVVTVNNLIEPFSMLSSVALLKMPSLMSAWYLVYVMRSDLLYKAVRAQMKGTGITRITLKQIELMTIPLPPLAEQKRIVAKIEELLPYLDRYEKAWNRLEDFGSRFPADMQKSILQMAIQGKLVEQRPEEGTGEELYQQIQDEKKRLIQEGKIKKEKPLPEIAEDEVPFEIPEGWKWVRLGQAIDMLSGFAFKSSDFKETGHYRLLRGINLGVATTRWDDTVYVDEMPKKLEPYRIQKGDVLIGLDRPWISDGIRVTIYNDEEQTYVVQRVLRVRETCAIIKEYIALLLRSNLFKSAVEGQTTGISVPHISPGQVGNVVIPLPPIAEQKRIVARLEEILPLCERLK